MMNFGWGNGYYLVNPASGTFITIFQIVIIIDFILLGVWLWKKINK